MKKSFIYFIKIYFLLLTVLILAGIINCEQPAADARVNENDLHEINISVNDRDIESEGVIDLGTLYGGAQGDEIIVKIENQKRGILKLTGDPVVLLTGSDAGSFQLDLTNLNQSIKGGSFTVFKLKIISIITGQKSLTVTIENNDIDEKDYTFTINVNSEVCGLLVSSSEILYRNNDLFLCEDTVTGYNTDVILTLNNTDSDRSLIIGTVLLSGLDKTHFSIVENCAGFIKPNESTALKIRFNPFSEGEKNADLIISSNDVNFSIYKIKLRGTGVYRHGSIEVSLNEIDSSSVIPIYGYYNYEEVGVTHQKTINFKIKNKQEGVLRLTGEPKVVIGGVNPDSYSIVQQPLTDELFLNETAGFSVTFSPLNEGEKSCIITILSNDPVTPVFSFYLFGHAYMTYPGIEVEGVEHTGSVNISGRRSIIFKITNSGDTDLILTGNPLIQHTATGFYEYTLTQPVLNIIPPGGYTEFKFSFKSYYSESYIEVRIPNNDTTKNPYIFTIYP